LSYPSVQRSLFNFNYRILALNLIYRSIEEALQNGGAVLFFPKLKDIIPEWSGYNGIRRQVGICRDIFTKTVTEHKNTISEAYSRDLIDVFLKEIKSNVDPNSAFYKDFGGKSHSSVIGLQ